MDILTNLYSGLGLSYLIPFVFVLTIVVFFHELGHFYVARRCGVKVEVFSVGFGRAIKSWTDRHGTEWRLSWIPLGGYVRFAGDENAASAPDKDGLAAMDAEARKDTLFYKPLWQRMAVVAAGPIANFLLAIVIFAGLYTAFGQVITQPVVSTVVEASAAERAGFKAGDLIVSIDGEEVASFNEVRRVVSVSANTELKFIVTRDAAPLTLFATPDRYLEVDRFGNEYQIGRLGVSVSGNGSTSKHVRYNPVTAVWMGVEESAFIVQQTFTILGRIIMGRESAESLGGPIRIAQLSGQTATLGIVALINLMAILSVSIGLVNLFPIPMLDGGHLMYYTYEAIAGKPLSAKAQDIGMRIGLSLVMLLFIFVTVNDLARINAFGRVASFFGF